MKKIIHYCWFGKNELPELAKKCIKSWQKYLPEYEIIEWNEKNFDIKSNKYVEQAYNAGKFAFVSDYARLKIVYDNGGIYFDTDVELIAPIEEKYLKSGYFALEDANLINTGLGFCAEKHNKLLEIMLKDYENINFINDSGKMDLTSCPIRNSMSLIQQKYNLNNKKIESMYLLSPTYCNPLDYKTGLLNIEDNTFSVHYGAASWLDDQEKKFMRKRHFFIKKYGIRLGYLFYYIYKIIYIIVIKIRKDKTND